MLFRSPEQAERQCSKGQNPVKKNKHNLGGRYILPDNTNVTKISTLVKKKVPIARVQNSPGLVRKSVIKKDVKASTLSEAANASEDRQKRKRPVIQETSKKPRQHIINLPSSSLPWKVPISRQGRKNVILV